jgi:glycosyltransferase involved in cell wall biosynthesis
MIPDLRDFFAAMDLFVFHQFRRTWVSPFKAMAHRVPVVASRVGGIPELVIERRPGYFFASDPYPGRMRSRGAQRLKSYPSMR